jgi:hypothetical protein
VNLKKRAEAPPTPPASSAAAPVASAAPLPPPVASAPAPEAPKPPPSSPNRVPAYAVLGIGGAAAVGALVTGLVANGKFASAEKDCKPSCPDKTVDSIKSMALVSDILTGVAVVGVGVGAVLFFTAKPGTETAAPSASLRPLVAGSVGPRGGQVQATWRF